MAAHVLDTLTVIPGLNSVDEEQKIPISERTPVETIPINVFTGGTQTSQSGVTKTFSEKELDDVVESYNPTQHIAPLIQGHEEQFTGAPSMGWVKNLFRKGLELFANVDLSGYGKSQLEEGNFRRVSCRFYPPDDPNNPTPGKLSLRHLALVAIPAVKGLAQFSEGNQNHLAFSEEVLRAMDYTFSEKEFSYASEESQDEVKAALENAMVKFNLDSEEEEKEAATDQEVQEMEMAEAEDMDFASRKRALWEGLLNVGQRMKARGKPEKEAASKRPQRKPKPPKPDFQGLTNVKQRAAAAPVRPDLLATMPQVGGAPVSMQELGKKQPEMPLNPRLLETMPQVGGSPVSMRELGKKGWDMADGPYQFDMEGQGDYWKGFHDVDERDYLQALSKDADDYDKMNIRAGHLEELAQARGDYAPEKEELLATLPQGEYGPKSIDTLGKAGQGERAGHIADLKKFKKQLEKGRLAEASRLRKEDELAQGLHGVPQRQARGLDVSTELPDLPEDFAEFDRDSFRKNLYSLEGDELRQYMRRHGPQGKYKLDDRIDRPQRYIDKHNWRGGTEPSILSQKETSDESKKAQIKNRQENQRQIEAEQRKARMGDFRKKLYKKQGDDLKDFMREQSGEYAESFSEGYQFSAMDLIGNLLKGKAQPAVPEPEAVIIIQSTEGPTASMQPPLMMLDGMMESGMDHPGINIMEPMQQKTTPCGAIVDEELEEEGTYSEDEDGMPDKKGGVNINVELEGGNNNGKMKEDDDDKYGIEEDNSYKEEEEKVDRTPDTITERKKKAFNSYESDPDSKKRHSQYKKIIDGYVDDKKANTVSGMDRKKKRDHLTDNMIKSYSYDRSQEHTPAVNFAEGKYHDSDLYNDASYDQTQLKKDIGDKEYEKFTEETELEEQEKEEKKKKAEVKLPEPRPKKLAKTKAQETSYDYAEPYLNQLQVYEAAEKRRSWGDFAEGLYTSGVLTESIVNQEDLVNALIALDDQSSNLSYSEGQVNPLNTVTSILSNLAPVVGLNGYDPDTDPRTSASEMFSEPLPDVSSTSLVYSEDNKDIAFSADSYHLHQRATKLAEAEGIEYYNAVRKLIS